MFFPIFSLLILLKTRSVSKTFVCLLLETTLRFYYFIVVWNPSVASLYMRTTAESLSSAARTCRFDAKQATLWSSSAELVSAGEYYEEYHSHPVALLARVRNGLVAQGCKQFIYLAGDSSLDNKHWLFKPFTSKTTQLMNDDIFADAVNGYETILHPPRMAKDVSYWLNLEMSKRKGSKEICTIMSAIEESTVEDRSKGLLSQDVFIREHITENDYLILSVGGNDVALRPSARTAFNMLMLTQSPVALIKNGWAPGFGYFFKFFHDRVEKLVQELVGKRKPKAVLVCMIYFPDEQKGGSWADHTLGALGYNSDPSKLQLIIRTLFEKIAEKGFNIPGVDRVIPFPLFSVLDGNDHGDYLQRVEPSAEGGRKMALAFADTILSDGVQDVPAPGNGEENKGTQKRS